MYKLFIIVFLCCFSTINSTAQMDDRAKAKMERYEKEMGKKQAEFIAEFIDELEVDDFQKHIIAQKLNSYLEAKKVIYTLDIESYKRKEIIAELDHTHFKDLQEMCSKEVMDQIMSLVQQKPKTRKKKKN